MSQIPSESKAKCIVVKGPPGSRGQAIEDYLADQVETPRIASEAKQAYTKQTVQTDELMTTPTQAGVTSAGQRTVSGPSAITAQTGTTTATGAPSALTQRTMTAATVGTPTAATTMSLFFTSPSKFFVLE